MRLRVEQLKGHPAQNRTYVLGADPSGGTGNDLSAIEIVCLETLEQVLEVANSEIDPVAFGHLCCQLGKEFNNAFLVIEANHHGIATHAVVKKNYPLMRIFKRYLPVKGTVKYGFNTSRNTKAELVGACKELIDLGLTIYSDRLVTAMLSFEEDPDTGVMQGPEDDLVIAICMASVGCFKYSRFKRETVEEDRRIETTTIEERNRRVPTGNLAVYTFEDLFEEKFKPHPALPRMLRA